MACFGKEIRLALHWIRLCVCVYKIKSNRGNMWSEVISI